MVVLDTDYKDIHRLSYSNKYDRIYALDYIRKNFQYFKSKKFSWNVIRRLVHDEDADVRQRAAETLGIGFSFIPNKSIAWEDLRKLIYDKDIIVRRGAAVAIGWAFSSIIDKKIAWEDLHELTQDKDMQVRWMATTALGWAYPSIPNKMKAWEDLHRLSKDVEVNVRSETANALGWNFTSIPRKSIALEDLNQLTQDEFEIVRMFAYYSLGKISITKSIKAKTKKQFKIEFENALIFFKGSANTSTLFNPAYFCFPFYQSYYSIVYHENEKDVTGDLQKYIIDAKKVSHSSKSKKILIEVIENLEKALVEVLNNYDSKTNFKDTKDDLNSYKQYFDHAINLLRENEKESPDEVEMIQKGIPIIDNKIKRLLKEISKNTKALCQESRGTEWEIISKEVYKIGGELVEIRDRSAITSKINLLQDLLKVACLKIPPNEQLELNMLLQKSKENQVLDHKLDAINIMMGILITYINREKIMEPNINIDTINIYGQNNPIYINAQDNRLIINDSVILDDKKLLTFINKIEQLIEDNYKENDKSELLKDIKDIKENPHRQDEKQSIKNKLEQIINKIGPKIRPLLTIASEGATIYSALNGH